MLSHHRLEKFKIHHSTKNIFDIDEKHIMRIILDSDELRVKLFPESVSSEGVNFNADPGGLPTMICGFKKPNI